VEVGNAISEDPGTVSESEATCRSLAFHPRTPVPAAAEGLSVAIDVGGGSTDFAFWSAGNLLDQFSFKLAANDVLTGDWYGLEDYLGRISWAATGQHVPITLRTAERNTVEVYVNHLLSQAKYDGGASYDGANPLAHPAIERIFGLKPGGLENSPWYYIRTLAYLFFGGITYFTGLQARQFNNLETVTICFGGRGASLLAWLWNNGATLRKVLCEFFKAGRARDAQAPFPSVKIVGAALGHAANLPQLKKEVATGALQKRLGTVNDPGDPCVGEINWRGLGGAPVDWTTRQSADKMKSLARPSVADGSNCYIQEFLHLLVPLHTALNIDMTRISQLEVDWDAIQQINVIDLVNTQVNQSVFACELKALMQQYVEQVLNAQ
jgi:hypothetical protein